MGIRIDALDATATPSRDHEVPAMKDNATVKLTVDQILELIDETDVQAGIAAATSDDTFDDTDELVYLTGSDVKRGTLTGLLSSIFKTARTIANAQFASASFKLFNAAGTPRALTFNTAALTEDRVVTFPDRNMDFTTFRPWVELAPAPTTSGTAVDWTSIPAGVTDVELWFQGVSLNGNDSMLLQLGSGGAVQTTGYVGASLNLGPRTDGFGLFSNVGVYSFAGVWRLHRTSGNTWIASQMLAELAAGGFPVGAGSVSLSGPLDTLRFRSLGGAQTFDAGSIQVRYR